VYRLYNNKELLTSTRNLSG